jgi:hypothetical protein
MVGSGRSWPPSANGWPAMPFLHGVRDALIKDRRLSTDDGERGPRTVVRGAPKGRTFQKRRWMQLKFNNGIRDRGLKQELCLGIKKTLYEAFRQTRELDVMKRAVVISIGLWKMSDWTLWRGRLPPKRKKRRLKHSPQKRWWWYSWMGSHLIRKPIRTSGLKEGAAGAVGE